MPEQMHTMTVVLQVTEAQAAALKAMFDYWNFCGSAGMSREVSFDVDGDGNFHPQAQMIFQPPLSYLAVRHAEDAVSRDKGGDRYYSPEPVAQAIDKDRHPEHYAPRKESAEAAERPEEVTIIEAQDAGRGSNA